MPYIDPNLIPRLPDYGNMRTDNPPTSGGPRTTPSSIGRFTGNPYMRTSMDLMSGGVSALPGFVTDMIFGGDNSSFQPYRDAHGNWVFSQGRNPVPMANTPGAPRTPNANYQRLAGNAQALQDLLPYLNQAVNQGGESSALSQLRSAQQTAPGYADLMTNLFNIYGPLLNQIGNQIQRESGLYQAGSTNQILEGPGAQTVTDAQKLQQQLDPEYYATRTATSGRLQDLLGSIDLSGALSPNERDEIAKGLARQNTATGTNNSPSATNTVANAMTYGQAGHARAQEAKSNLTQAIQAAAGFLPASKSGMDAFQIATGRTSMSNPGAGLFGGINQSGGGNSNAFGLAGQLLGNFGQQDTTQMGINANKKDWLDQFSQLTGALGGLTGSAGKLAML